MNVESRVVDLLSRLVACPSVNPAGRAAPYSPPFGEAALAAWLADYLCARGAEVAIEPALPERPNLLARWPGRDRSRALMLSAHLDTVSVEGMGIPPFEPVVRDGRLYGRGACDDKGPMAAVLLGIEQALADGPPPTDLWFVGTCNEEHGAGGARALVSGARRWDAALVAEPTGFGLVWASKGVARWRIRTIGRSVHSSVPENGVNAIDSMMRAIASFRGPLKTLWEARHHPDLGGPRWSVGTICGGTQVNVLPAECTIEVDRRLIPGEDPEAVTAEVRRELDRLRQADPQFRYELELTEFYPALQTDPEGPFARTVEAAIRARRGGVTRRAEPWGSDAGVFHAAGIPSLLFGPGDLEQAHTSVEFIEIAQVVTAVDVYARVIREFR